MADSDAEIKIEGNIDIEETVKKAAGMSVNIANVNAREWVQRRRENIRPWSEFLKSSRFSKPNSVTGATSRIVKNVETFQSNYIFVFIGLAVYCLLTSPMLIFALIFLLGALYWVTVKNESRKLKIMSYELTLFQQYAAIGACSFPLFFIAGAGSAVFWVIGASFFFIMLHATFYNPQDLDDDTVELEMEEVTLQ